MKLKVIGTATEGVKTWHALGVLPDHATLCGILIDDDIVLKREPEEHQKITCVDCHQAWRNVVELKLTEFKFLFVPKWDK